MPSTSRVTCSLRTSATVRGRLMGGSGRHDPSGSTNRFAVQIGDASSIPRLSSTAEGISHRGVYASRSWCAMLGDRLRWMWYSTSEPPTPATARGPRSLSEATAPSGPASAPAFFFQIAPGQRDEQMSQRHQTHVMVPADPRPRLVLRHPQVALGVLEITPRPCAACRPPGPAPPAASAARRC